MNSIDLSQVHWFCPLSSPLYFWAYPVCVVLFVCLLYFSLLIFLFVRFNGFYFFSEIFCSFSCFRVIFDCALNQCYHSCFKIHPIVPGTCDSSQYWHHWDVFSHYAVIFLVLGIMCSFLLYLWNWNLLLLKSVSQFKFRFSVVCCSSDHLAFLGLSILFCFVSFFWLYWRSLAFCQCSP